MQHIEIPSEVKQDISKFKEYISTASPQVLDHILTSEIHAVPSDYVDLVSFELATRGESFRQKATQNNDVKNMATMDDMRYDPSKDLNRPIKAIQFEAHTLTGMNDSKLQESREIFANNPPELSVSDMHGWGINARYENIRVLAEATGDSIVFNVRESDEIIRQNYLNELKKKGLLDENVPINEKYLLPDEDTNEDLNFNNGGSFTDSEVNLNRNSFIDEDDYEDC